MKRLDIVFADYASKFWEITHFCIHVFVHIWGTSSEEVPLSMYKLHRFRSPWACANYHPGIHSPFIRSVVFNDSFSGQWRPWSDCLTAQADLGHRFRHIPEDMFSHGAAFWYKTAFTLKMPRKPASENVVCLCRLLNILANFSNLFLHTGKQCGPWSDCS